ncbi:helix-turn-helix transcriptional regulator [Paenibacillus humicola]|uniref:helix-turn-helix transcriptional regulator n=1 Tax=Paenibacillus humicola TaxID=3110540 RepID=UPI00237B6F8D|nr:AraC family transcriptional regulator [Paenibacillus humicola]
MIPDDYEGIIPDMRYFICRYSTPSWCIRNQVIDFVDLTYIFEGKVTYIVNGVPYEAEQGDLICIPKQSLRQANIDPDHHMAAYASNLRIYHIEGLDVSLPFPVHSKIGLRDDLLSLYQELNIEWMQKKPGYMMKVRAIFLTILHKYFSLLFYKDAAHPVNPHVQKALHFIHERYDCQIDVAGLAAMIDLNPSYFGTLFKKHTGVTVKEYVNRIRINNAENMLASSEFSIAEAALKCGFEDPFYFSKVFKKIKGYSPSKVKLV